MDQRSGRTGFGALLRRWRLQRGLSQLGLSTAADVSARHLSWLETDRATPSRAMVLRLCEHLAIPLRERNGLLAAAGYAPMYTERRADDPAMRPATRALQLLLDAHEPWPALAVDRHWNLVAHNRMVALLMQAAAEPLRTPPVNVLRLTLHPQGLAPMVQNLASWRAHILQRLQRQIAASGDGELVRLQAELAAMDRPPPSGGATAGGLHPASPAADPPAPLPDDIAASLVLHTPQGRLHFLTTITVFGAPHDVGLAELAVETLLPADEATAAALRRVHAAVVTP